MQVELRHMIQFEFSYHSTRMSGGTAAAVSLLLLLATASCRAEVTDSELSRFMQSIWNSDVNRLSLVDAVRLNLQSRTYTSSSTDRAPARFVLPSLFRS